MKNVRDSVRRVFSRPHFTWRKVVAFGLTAVLGYLFFWPVPIDPEEHFPAQAPLLEGKYAVNHKLIKVERLGTKEISASEDVAIDSVGRVYSGTSDGKIMRSTINGGDWKEVACLQGAVLGMAFDDNGNLYAAVPDTGLVQITSKGEVWVVSKGAEGASYLFINDLDVAEDGVVYFTDSSSRHELQNVYREIFEHRPTGRLLSYDPQKKAVEVLADELYFPNGLAMGPDDEYLLFTEMTNYRILRHWLKGERAGVTEPFAQNLPGMLDGISFNGKDTFWVAVYTTRAAALDKWMYPYPIIREILFRLPKWMRPNKQKYAFVLGFDIHGRVVANLQDPEGGFAPVTNVVERNGYLYLGSTEQKGIARYSLNSTSEYSPSE